MVLAPDGRAEFLWGGRSPLLGLSGHVEFEESEEPFEGGSTLALYTDGLIEVPGEDLDTGLARLRDAILTGPPEPDALCDHVIDRLRVNALDRDDVALLTLRSVTLASDLMRLEIPADPGSLRQARRLLMRWLDRTGASEQEAEEIQLACHEACMNAVEHAHRVGEHVFQLEAGVAAGCVLVTVRDSGGWHEPAPGRDGKGLELMNGLMDNVSVGRGGDGTVVELRRQLSGVPVAR
jgi:anti-sigma regulatory factor (Ser/Thr protein kinase)